jgi:hypothetical protein
MCGRVDVSVGVGVGVALPVGVGVGVAVGLSVGVGTGAGEAVGEAVGESVGMGGGSSAGLALTDAAHTNGTTETAATISGISRLAGRTRTPDGSVFLRIKVCTA